MDQDVVIKMEKIGMTEGDKVWFHPFDFQLNRREVAAIQCDHATGKLLFQLLIGQESSSGTIAYFNKAHPREPEKYRQQVGVVMHEEGVYERLAPSDYLKFFQKLYGSNSNIDELLHKVNLYGVRAKPIRHLDYSQRKRLAFAKALVHNPALVIFEEPDQNIDLESKVILRGLVSDLKKQGKSALIITSNMESAVILTNDVYRLTEAGLKKISVVDQSEVLSGEVSTENGESDPKENQSFQMHLERIPAKVEEKILLFDPMEIDFIESMGGAVQLHVKENSFPCTITLNQLTERLEPFGFFRCHRSYIVNLQKVREVMTWTRNSYSLILDDDKKSNIPLSKGKLQDLKNVLRV
ncbi:transcriptional regulator, LytTR family [Halobacillus karajensis]|uniref:Fluoroquinolones export ATP-binding proteinc/MT2762 n=1 Tax=Halobacillus karajensis TaxID=195088 RepID=A0A024P917_9BACI|nr:LytTR family transcriptional regulator DNA-binding domain-containing protein [Halobacillus karajensis]CDQ21252.1 Fluoroquinolones export ATP-binding proteinc/MT2762 [Halobacillus karajensis]CDQ25328.1 Fluoroquinolones export ATP-binding proteinc/MT2762 [Halobacillus karajensis]CDQ25949.1 Fluoroquinolones export ATP-binding proteinc/MT2762 [Halobacillus karajensis]SEI10073.1 transcriptional regulator, LytTR family [Halobacillus karajensis]